MYRKTFLAHVRCLLARSRPWGSVGLTVPFGRRPGRVSGRRRRHSRALVGKKNSACPRKTRYREGPDPCSKYICLPLSLPTAVVCESVYFLHPPRLNIHVEMKILITAYIRLYVYRAVLTKPIFAQKQGSPASRVPAFFCEGR